MRRALLLAAVLATGAPNLAFGATEARLTEATARAFIARQEAAWNARDARAFAATFAPGAVFIDQASGSDGKVVVNGRSTLAEALVQARRFFAKAPFQATATVDRVALSPDGRTARVVGRETTRIAAPGKPSRTYCARTEQTLALVAGRIVSHGQTDTDVRCPH